MSVDSVTLGTRGSPLALRQTELVIEQLRQRSPELRIEVRTIRTAGDRDQHAPVQEFAADGVFVRALEQALLDDRIEAAVHSLKDLPGALMPNCVLAAFLLREEPADALVSSLAGSIADLPRGARVGTGSARRKALLLEQRPDLRVEGIRGNVDTRLRKLREGHYDALVLALAPLQRLGLQDLARERLDPEVFVPAPGQGTLAVEARADRPEILALLAGIDDPEARAAAEAERAFLVSLAGGCLLPAGVFARRHNGALRVVGFLADPDGSRIRRAAIEGPVDAAARLGDRLARQLRGGALAGQTVVVTRPREQAAELLDALAAVGASVVALPTIEILPPVDWGPVDRALDRLADYQWVTCTSVNGARALSRRLAQRGRRLDGVRVAAVGEATAEALRQAGMPVAFVPPEHRAEALAAALPGAEGARVLVVRGDQGQNVLAQRLRARGATVDEVVAYRTVAADPAVMVKTLPAEIHWIVLASGSAARSLAALPPAAWRRVQAAEIACIGPETAAAARAAGFRVTAVAVEPSAAALVAAIARPLPG